MATTRLQNLHIYVKVKVGNNTEYQEIRTTTTEYKIVRDSIDKALVLLEYGRGRNSLRQLAEAIIRGRWAIGNKHCLYPKSDTGFIQLDGRINQFLRQMRDNFPPVVLRAIAGEAATMRKTWSKADSTLDDYDTQEAGELHIHHGLLDCMARTRNLDETAIFSFQMVLSIAHEITHFLTGFITGTARPLTPREVSVTGWKYSGGEAGRYWEEKFIGGVVEFYADPRIPRNTDQAGIPYIFDNFNEDSPGTFVSRNYIDAIFDGRATLPVAKSKQAPTTTRKSVRDTSNEMTVVRQNSGPTSPPALITGGSSAAGNSSGSSRNRAILGYESQGNYTSSQSYDPRTAGNSSRGGEPSSNGSGSRFFRY